MCSTPKTVQQQTLDILDFSGFDSPSSNASSEFSSTSSLNYINSQLVAHGFSSPPGICLDGIAKADLERVIKCLLSMLSQRMDDIARTENLNTKLRTLTYDYERMVSLHKEAAEKAANAEREASLHKSRLLNATSALQTSETAHKRSTAELQRTRNLLQSLRTMHQTELTKKEKEVERMAEKWARLASSQPKTTISPGSGTAGVKPAQSTFVNQGDTLLGVALKQAEAANHDLRQESERAKALLLDAVNEMQDIVHGPTNMGVMDEPSPFTRLPLALGSAQEASEALSEIIQAWRGALSKRAGTGLAGFAQHKTDEQVSSAELERLRDIINGLQTELAASRCAANDVVKTTCADSAIAAQTVLDQFAADPRITRGKATYDASFDLMTAPERDAEKDRLDGLKSDLEEERRKFTEAAVQLGKDRAALEAARQVFKAEKRCWEVEKMLSELPPTPLVDNGNRKAVGPLPARSPRKTSSPGKSPRKSARTSRKSLLALSSRAVEPAFETEVVPSEIGNVSRAAPPIAAGQARASLLPTSFTLPPPSPLATLPVQPTLPPVQVAPLLFPPPPIIVPSVASKPTGSVPATPAPLRPFPVAKPLAQRMIHAYSPAKPSPLSRILMLGNSPDSLLSTSPSEPRSGRPSLEAVIEEEAENNPFSEESRASLSTRPALMLEELGVAPEPPLQDMKARTNAVNFKAATRTPVFRAPEPVADSKDKGKGRAVKATKTCVVSASSAAVSRAGPAYEKENGITHRKKREITVRRTVSRGSPTKQARSPAKRQLMRLGGKPPSRAFAVSQTSKPASSMRDFPAAVAVSSMRSSKLKA
ncbi:hypothetical protein FISHEDRAFT_76977 [Fistulina hepatica ATCC 64428]|uniref:Afadin and alpha-actinin-binding-domain-containing protein n=1 Tax=Fistulina hepatica ATCC 64428 TaxID=1128425 RepID=A0A0D7A2K0_9AGAR|nr:hypothetical protein FISHEDRAFT_76977 [Fistulina hepatica ATCC 64428]